MSDICITKLNTEINTKYDRNKRCSIVNRSRQRAGGCIYFNYGKKNKTCGYDVDDTPFWEYIKNSEKIDAKYHTCVILQGLECPYYKG